MAKITFLVLLLCITCTGQAMLGQAAKPSDTISAIDFFGYQGLDLAKVRGALPVHAGSYLTDKTKGQIEAAVTRTIARKPTDVADVCCNIQGQSMIYIGLPGRSYRPFTYNPTPAGKERLPQEIVDLNRHTSDAIFAAVKRGGGSATEDDSQGYALINDPAARALEQREHTWALGHEAELLRVLRNSSDVDQRQVASEVLGYAKPSREQIVALDYASDDPDSTVRNNATRALMVLLRWNPDFAAQLNTQKVIAMLGAGKWTDRNKAVGLLEPMTQQRDQKLLAMLRTQALEQLVEMAKWTNTGHAYEARLVLGRIAGLPEGDVRRMASTGQVEALVNAARKKK